MYLFVVCNNIMPCGPQVQCVSGLGGWDHKDLMDADGWVGNEWYLGGNMDTLKRKAMCKGQNYDWTSKLVGLLFTFCVKSKMGSHS